MDGLVGDEYDGRELPFCRDGVKHPLNSLLCDSGRSDSIASSIRCHRIAKADGRHLRALFD